jgi:aminoglycoside phosphotransferase (APT) family kinase protein
MIRQWNAEVSLSAELVCTLIEQQFRELAPVRAEFVGEGWDNAVFRVNDRFVFRFPRRAPAVDCMEAECRVLPHLVRRLPLPVPNPVFVGKPSELYPYPFAGYSMLAGNAAHTRQPSRQQRVQSAPLFANFLKELHGTPVEQAVQMGAGPDKIGRLDLERRTRQFDQYLKEAFDLGLLDKGSPLWNVAEWLPAAESVSQKPALVHGDLNFRNFLLDAEGVLCGVIDWGDVHIGHPAVDLAVAHSFLPPEGREIFRRAYGEIDKDTWLLAKFRALYTNLYLLVYAYDIGDPLQLREAKTALELATAE